MKSPEQGASNTVVATVSREWERPGGTYLEDCAEASIARPELRWRELSMRVNTARDAAGYLKNNGRPELILNIFTRALNTTEVANLTLLTPSSVWERRQNSSLEPARIGESIYQDAAMNKPSEIHPMSLNQPNQGMEMLKHWSIIYMDYGMFRPCPN